MRTTENVLDTIQAHVIRHVQLDRKMGGERESERWCPGRWTAGKIRVGAEARRGKAEWQAKTERIEAGHHPSRTSARTARLYVLSSCRYQPGGKIARVVCIRAGGARPPLERHTCGASDQRVV
jgi:hypothetical protein